MGKKQTERVVMMTAGETLNRGFSMTENVDKSKIDVGESVRFLNLTAGGSYRIGARLAKAKHTQHLPKAEVKIKVSG
jgi:hypothetical protein